MPGIALLDEVHSALLAEKVAPDELIRVDLLWRLFEHGPMPARR